jgi:hypothetical protein
VLSIKKIKDKINSLYIRYNIIYKKKNMSKLAEMSFADLKAAGEYLERIKSDRIKDLKSQGIDIKTDKGLEEMDKLEFDIHNILFMRLMKLKKQ